jgi:hypothetical protein
VRRRAILQALHQLPSTRPLLYPRQHDLVHAGEDVSAPGSFARSDRTTATSGLPR